MSNVKKCSACNIERPLMDFVSKSGRVGLKNCQRCRNFRNSKCVHNKLKYKCGECSQGVCTCGKTGYCAKCYDPIKVSILSMIRCLSIIEIKRGKYDVNNFIDYEFVRNMYIGYNSCHFCTSRVDMFSEVLKLTCVVGRLDLTKSYTKDNCVLSCINCCQAHL